MTFGATPQEWAHFDVVLGLTEDLLPVVSNPNAVISPQSKMKGLGKTPSRYNRQREVAGFTEWTKARATDTQVAAWSGEPDYGICIQTREVRALDIDVDNKAMACEIAEVFRLCVGGELPARTRANSGKRLLAFIVHGDLAKRSFKVDGGLVEFLATGQQFIAAGTHTSGARYEWAGGLPASLPVLTVEAFEAAWQDLVEWFATEPERAPARGQGKGDGTPVGDEVADWLEDNWETYGIDRGKLFVACPWKDGHSSDSGETEAAWLLAGTGGYARGHFECLHASCAARTDDDFLHATGCAAADFPDLVAEEAEQRAAVARSGGPQALVVLDDTSPVGLSRTKDGMIEVTVNNVSRALDAVGWLGFDIRFDEFKGQVVWSPAGTEQWRPWTDADYSRLRLRLEHRGFKPVGRELARDMVNMRADNHRIDTAIVWLDGLRWDGTPRIEQFWSTYFSVEDTPYTRAVGLYTWTALAGRALEPGLQADMVPVLTGAQGAGKSRGVAAIAPSDDTRTALSFHEPDTERARKMKGVLVAELAELQGLRTRDLESIKAWITRSREHWVPKYQEMATSYPRRCLLFGTTNEDEFLADETGERRWLPMKVGALVDIEGIKRDRDQLWAEAAAMFTVGGLAWRGAVELAPAAQEAFSEGDPWVEAIARWMGLEDLDGTTPASRGHLTPMDVAGGALHLPISNVDLRVKRRIGKCLKGMGYKNVQLWLDGRNQKVWMAPASDG